MAQSLRQPDLTRSTDRKQNVFAFTEPDIANRRNCVSMPDRPLTTKVPVSAKTGTFPMT
ncbi:hypothetical protein ACLB1E_03070 [Escherichia coli]